MPPPPLIPFPSGNHDAFNAPRPANSNPHAFNAPHVMIKPSQTQHAGHHQHRLLTPRQIGSSTNTTNTTTPTTAAATAAAINSGPSGGAIAGIVVGSLFGFLVLLGILYCCWKLGNPGATYYEGETKDGEKNSQFRQDRDNGAVVFVGEESSPDRPPKAVVGSDGKCCAWYRWH